MTFGPKDAARPLPAPLLRRVTDPTTLREDLRGTPVGDELIGQSRATDAIGFGSAIRKRGFNLYAMGLQGTGRLASIRAFLTRRAQAEKRPDDWVYVNNFEVPEKPQALRLPPGTAVRFRAEMDTLIADLSIAIPALFDSDEYKARRGAIDQEFEEAQEQAFSALNEAGRAKSVTVMKTPVGFAFAPVRGGEAIKPEEFNALPDAERERIQTDIKALQEQLKGILMRMPASEKAHRDQVRQLNREMAGATVAVEMREVAEALGHIPTIQAFLDAAANDLVANLEIFLETGEATPNAPAQARNFGTPGNPRLKRYRVNVMVGDGDGGAGSPVVLEPDPTYHNVIGRIEHISQMGALLTDFTLIRPGALHRANGGYLILDAREILSQPLSWAALKRSLKSGLITVKSMAEQVSLVSTISLDPDPIPLDAKIVLIGDRWLYYTLMAADPDFIELFKVEVDFDDEFDRTADNTRLYARAIEALTGREKLRPIDDAGLARMVDEASRLAEDAEKLSLRIGVVADILREADHWAGEAGHERIGADDVARAVAERRRRSERIGLRVRESITRDIVLVATDGAAVGQINGLSVSQIGAQSFGRPTRITARTRLGSGKLIDIEREVALGGPLHSKGVLILSGFLAARYAPDVPVSLHASLVFEQSYGGIDGDSASSAELYALLSALAEVPIRQSFAVTGSVNQFGEVQAIGGVNEKIEGFFDICVQRGLSGAQGVLIPLANVKHLMLREDVVEACSQGRFSVTPVATIDQGIEILTGLAAGARDDAGHFPADSVNGRVEARLRAFAASRRRFGIGRAGVESDADAT
ncbi:MAG: AAA family ATPase [Alphaproteobacteria bacterium]|nr:AAA family ATPase [Alphaproteobacteria bacterium]MCW5743881.1 AAA family ATPase [Alphaproteobacteria bacterium]